MKIFRDFSASSLTAGFVAALVGYSSSVAIVFQAMAAAGASPEQISAWLMALGLGMGLSCIGLSWYYKTPVLTAWSTPGAAFLVTGLGDATIHEAVGAFLFSGVLITLCGITGWFERIMNRIPVSLASALLAGVLLQFGLNLFAIMNDQALLVIVMFIAYLLRKRLLPQYAIALVLALGMALAWAQGLLAWDHFSLKIVAPIYVAPVFSLPVLIGVGVPLFVVTMASQNIPGIAALRANGYQTPISPLLGWTGFTTVVLAPFGGYAFNLAAITAAICMGPDAHPDPAKRYSASIAAGFFYLLLGLFGATVGGLLLAFPEALVLAIAGLALLATIASSLHIAVAETKYREPALITFLVSASGINLLGIGAAFWGLVAGVLALLVLQYGKRD